MNWEEKKVLVTGGASFIGSSLVDVLLAKGAQIRIVDDLSSGHQENIQGHIDSGKVEFVKARLGRPSIYSWTDWFFMRPTKPEWKRSFSPRPAVSTPIFFSPTWTRFSI